MDDESMRASARALRPGLHRLRAAAWGVVILAPILQAVLVLNDVPPRGSGGTVYLLGGGLTAFVGVALWLRGRGSAQALWGLLGVGVAVQVICAAVAFISLVDRGCGPGDNLVFC